MRPYAVAHSRSEIIEDLGKFGIAFTETHAGGLVVDAMVGMVENVQPLLLTFDPQPDVVSIFAFDENGNLEADRSSFNLLVVNP